MECICPYCSSLYHEILITNQKLGRREELVIVRCKQCGKKYIIPDK